MPFAIALERRLADELGFRIGRQEPIQPWQAHNNRLLHLWSTDAREVVVKIYFQDQRQRLQREYTGLSFLRAQGIRELPTPLLLDDGYQFAVYSFESGATRTGAALSLRSLERVAGFAAALHWIHPDTPGSEMFPTSVPATFSLADQVRGIRARLDSFASYASSDAVESSVASLERETELPGRVELLISDVLQDCEDVPVAREAWSFSTGDLAPHNVLVTPDDDICVVDLEYSGWDDPVIPVADFLSAETSTDLSPDNARAFVKAYAQLAQLSAHEVRRLQRVRALMEVGWVAVHLSLLVPERIAPKRFADPAFDVAKHLSKHAQLASARLVRAERLVPTLLRE